MSVSDITPHCVSIFPTRDEMGQAAGAEVEKKIVELLKEKPEIRMVFAAAPSQNEMLDYLVNSNKIEWERITAFNMDEYVGLDNSSPESFAAFLNKRLFTKVPFKNAYLINGAAPVDEEIARYSGLLVEAPIDIICLGIGENGHIAFNDPPVADFNDKHIVKRVKLDDSCRMQQVNEGCFPGITEVPEYALTITIPVIMSGLHLFCVVPGASKQKAVYNTLNGPVSTSCPASILQTHPDCSFFFDKEAYNGNTTNF